jgi:hypothetical protein
MKREKGRRKGEKRSPLHPFLLLFKSPTLGAIGRLTI